MTDPTQGIRLTDPTLQALAVRDLTKIYGGQPAADSINLDIPRGGSLRYRRPQRRG